METYIILANYTQQGMANIKDAPSRIDAVKKAIESAGGKTLGWYLTMGRYDVVLIAQIPDALSAARLLLGFGALGNERTETLRAFNEEEFRKLVPTLP